ncbi:MAG: DUF1570 domain-containing protein [Fimbriiglobus sp.]|jgi:hypothetical protein|nr:DUF1570 domain-containing protein [Fimbriiglobus sp.]
MSVRSSRTLRSTLAGWLVLSGVIGCGSVPWKSATPRPAPPAEVRNPVAIGPAEKRPSVHATRVGRYVFHTDFEFDTHSALLRELEELPDQIEAELRVPASDSLIQIYLFDREDKYHAFLRAKDPKLPLRSAYFFAEPGRGLGSPPELHVYTWMSDRLRVDLRHELAHALLHGTLKTVPLWLDEGLAGYFEQPPTNGGVNAAHLEALRAPESGGRFRPDLARLEKLKSVDQMGRPEYQEAWAWVHFMLHADANTRQVLLNHLQALRTTATPGLLLPKLEAAVGDVNPLLAAHLTRLDQSGKVRHAGR